MILCLDWARFASIGLMGSLYSIMNLQYNDTSSYWSKRNAHYNYYLIWNALQKVQQSSVRRDSRTVVISMIVIEANIRLRCFTGFYKDWLELRPESRPAELFADQPLPHPPRQSTYFKLLIQLNVYSSLV